MIYVIVQKLMIIIIIYLYYFDTLDQLSSKSIGSYYVKIQCIVYTPSITNIPIIVKKVNCLSKTPNNYYKNIVKNNK